MSPIAFDGSRSEYYRDRAHKARELAERCQILEIKRQLEMVADQYDSLARQYAGGYQPWRPDPPK